MMPSNHLILCLPFLLCPQSFPASGSFPVSQFFASGGQSFGASASGSALPMNIQGWFPLGLTGLITLLSKWLSAPRRPKVFSSTTIWKHQFFSAQPSLWPNSHPYITTRKTTALTIQTFVPPPKSICVRTSSSHEAKTGVWIFLLLPQVPLNLLLCWGCCRLPRQVLSLTLLTYLMALLQKNNDAKAWDMCRVPPNSSSAQAPDRLSENLLCVSSQVRATNPGARTPAMLLSAQSQPHLRGPARVPDSDAGLWWEAGELWVSGFSAVLSKDRLLRDWSGLAWERGRRRLSPRTDCSLSSAAAQTGDGRKKTQIPTVCGSPEFSLALERES